MTPLKTVAALAAAGWTATAGATLATRHWRNRHRALSAIYREAIDERDELGTLLADLNDAVRDGRIPTIPPGYAAALRFAGRAPVISSSFGYGKNLAMRRWLRRYVDNDDMVITVEDPKAGEWR